MPYPTDLVRYIAVMRQGTIVEYGPTNPLFTSPTPPLHPKPPSRNPPPAQGIEQVKRK